MSQDYLALVDELQKKLASLQTAIAAQSELAPETAKDWLRSHHEIQTFFQTKMVHTDLEITPPYLSLQVEIDKQLKMLGVDLTMLQTSRRPDTWQKRHQQTGDRFKLLYRYCQMHLE